MANENASRDANRIPVLLATDDTTGETREVPTDADGNLLVAATVAGAGSGTVTSVSVVTSNGVSGSVATATTTPAITITLGAITPTSVNGLTISTTTGTLTLVNGSTLATSGANSITLTSTGATNVTLPTTGTLATLAGSEALTNKTINGLTVTSSTGTLTVAAGKTLTASNTLTFTGTDASSVAFGTGGIVAYTNVSTLSSLVSVGTITTGTWDATTIAVTAGGTGVETFTDGGVVIGNGTGALQVTSAGTAGQVLTSNGAGVDPTFQTASSTARYHLNLQLNVTSAQKAGATDPTDSTTINGVSCGTAAGNGAGSYIKFNGGTAATAQWDFYDKNPEFSITTDYTAGSSTGDGNMSFGDTGDATPPVATQVTKSMFVMVDTAAGTPTTSAVNADGVANTNTTLSGITLSQGNVWRVVKNSTTNIKYYYNYTLKATHTTNLPSGDCAGASWFEVGVDNDAGDTTTRTCLFGYLDVALDSPTG